MNKVFAGMHNKTMASINMHEMNRINNENKDRVLK